MSAAAKQLKTQQKPPLPDGKRRLLDAALKLTAQGTGFASLGIRELAREAGLNHNTFYRHFSDLEDLAHSVASEVAANIMANLKKVRAESAKHADATVGSVELILDYVQKDPAPFVVGLRELYGGAPNVRRMLRGVFEDIAVESVDQITSMNLAPGLSPEAILNVTRPVTYYMLYRAVECLDEPERRDEIAQDMITFIRQQFLGAYALQNMEGSQQNARQ